MKPEDDKPDINPHNQTFKDCLWSAAYLLFLTYSWVAILTLVLSAEMFIFQLFFENRLNAMFALISVGGAFLVGHVIELKHDLKNKEGFNIAEKRMNGLFNNEDNE